MSLDPDRAARGQEERRVLAIGSSIVAFVVVLILLLAGCLGMTNQDMNATREALDLSVEAYRRLDGGGAPRALMRGAACAEIGVLRRNKALAADAGALGIDCP